MDLKELGQELAKIGLPLLGAALPLPGGAALGAALAAKIGAPSSAPQDILTTLTQNADARQHAVEFQATHEETILRITTDAEIRAVEAVNKTMQAEASSDHWPTYSWRPYIGFNFGTYLGSLWFLPLLKIQPVVMSPDLVLAVGGILGVTAWWRGKMQAAPDSKADSRG